MLVITSSLRLSCHIHQFKRPNFLSTQQAEFKKHGPRNWLFQTEGSLVYKPVRLNSAPNDAIYLGNINDLNSDNSNKYEENDIPVINSLREEIKNMLSSMGDGRSSVSPYDTAWVSFIQDTNTNINGTSKRPLFPSCLQWIVDNQLVDGSWGEELVFCIYDRLLNTLASVVALTLWNTCLHKRNKGVMFIKENLRKLETGEVENMTCGFEFVFPALLEKAQQLDIDIPYDASVLKDIYARREVKFTRISKDVIHTIPTTVLFSLEGLRDLNWQRLLKLQMHDGSFLTSPASTAIAFMETNDDKCFTFLQYVVEKFNGGVPCSYPVDMQARLWAIDRLQRLGISYYFEEQIKDLLDYVFRYWDEENGLFSARNSNICDVDSTSMAIRLLRLHGFDVSPDVLNKFKNGDQFFCLIGELNKSPTVMFNLNRCSQALFPGEEILEEAKNFTYNFLQQCLASNQSKDKWVIAKDILGEIRYALEFPWYASLPRVESRLYIDQYGGADEIWIGKTLHRMPDVSNNVYLEAAKLDYNRCQSQHRFEWLSMQEWFEKCNFQQFGISKKEVLISYFLAAASIFEVEKSRQRLAWAKSSILCKMITSYFNQEPTTRKSLMLMEFKNSRDMSRKRGNETKEIMVLNNLCQFLHQLGKETYEDLGKDIHHQLHNLWEEWLISLMEENNSTCQEEAELVVHTINLSAGHMSHDDILSKHTNKVCRMLNELQNDQISNSSKARDIEFHMQALVKSDREFLYDILGEVIKAGATTLNIPDTVGYNIPSEYGQLIADIKANTPGIENVIISTHCQNDLGLSTANTLAGACAGARQLEVTINGIGERAGNASLEEVVMALKCRGDQVLGGLYTGINTQHIVPSSKMVEEYTGLQVQPHKAIVGANAFAHESGIHQDGMLKHKDTYEIISPDDIGLSRSNEAGIVLGKLSGRHALKSKMLELGYDIDGKELEDLFWRFKSVAEKKKKITDDDLIALMSDEVLQPNVYWKLGDVQITCGSLGLSTATVKLIKTDGQEHIACSVGTGPVDAAYKAVDLIVKVPITLLEYSMNAVTEGIDAIASTRVSIRSDDEHNVTNGSTGQTIHRTFSGTGADMDVVISSVRAYIGALNKMLSFEKLVSRYNKPEDSVVV